MARTSEESPIISGLPRAVPPPPRFHREGGPEGERLSERGSASKNAEENKRDRKEDMDNAWGTKRKSFTDLIPAPSNCR
jgi:hypothetical protein